MPKVVPKSEETKERIQKKLLEIFLFNALDQQDMKLVVDAFEEKSMSAGEFVIK